MATKTDIIHEIMQKNDKGRLKRIRKLLENDALKTQGDIDINPLYLAVFMHEQEIIDLLLDYGENIDSIDKNGKTAIASAVCSDKKELTRFLIARGANVNRLNIQDDLSGLSVQESFNLLLEAGFDVPAIDNYALAEKALNFNKETLPLLFEHGLYLNKKETEKYQTFLGRAKIWEMGEIVKNPKLVFQKYNDEKGLKPLPAYKRILGFVGERELFEAVQVNDEKVLKKALEHNQLDEKLKLDLVYECILRNRPHLLALLIDYNAPLEDKFDEDMSPLLFACLKNRSYIAKVLIAKGADVNFKAKKSELTPIMAAVMYSNYYLVSDLICKNADVNQTTKGLTPLMKAIELKRLKNLGVLARASKDYKVDLNFQDEEGKTALMKAIENGFVAGCKVLISEGADVFIKDNMGLDAYNYAMQQEQRKVASLIKEQVLKIYKEKKNLSQTSRSQPIQSGQQISVSQPLNLQVASLIKEQVLKTYKEKKNLSQAPKIQLIQSGQKISVSQPLNRQKD